MTRKHLIAITAAVCLVDWVTKATAWRLLPNQTMINPDASALIPIFDGLLEQPVLGGVIDLIMMLTLVISGVWLAKTTLPRSLHLGLDLVWSSWGSNGIDRWFLHHILAPGSVRGAVDWIPLSDSSVIPSMNIADAIHLLGVTVVVAHFAVRLLDRRVLAAILAAGILAGVGGWLAQDGLDYPPRDRPQTMTAAERVAQTVQWTGDAIVVHPHEYAVTLISSDGAGLEIARWRIVPSETIRRVKLPPGTVKIVVDRGHGELVEIDRKA